MKQSRFLLFLLVFSASGPLFAEANHFQSGLEQNQLIELYTSEGCSSCPPAEAWLNRLREDPALWHDRIPAAFHVGYWDKLGWKDRFSSPTYSARQRAYARHWRARTVYTPEFFVNGREWRRWYRTDVPDNSRIKVGNLKVTLQNKNLTARFQPEGSLPDKLTLHVALLGMNRTTQIRAGERNGEKTTHHFVVLGHKSVASKERRWQTRLPQPQPDEAGQQALAVWITRSDDPRPIQSTGGRIRP